MKLYIFFREGMFYPLELRDDAQAIENALCNPGTTKVERWENGNETVVWEPTIKS